MSRRYGRNQKRTHRNRIAELEHQVVDLTNNAAMWERCAELAIKEACRAKDILAVVVRDIEEVAYHSALLPPKQSGIEMPEGADRVIYPLREKTERWVEMVRHPPRLDEITIHTIDLWRIRMLVQEAPVFRRLLHLQFKPGKGVGYAITDEALAHLVEHRGGLVYAMQEILKMMLEQMIPVTQNLKRWIR